MENNFSVSVSTKNGVYSVTFTDKKSNMSFGIMSRNPEKIRKWLENHLTK